MRLLTVSQLLTYLQTCLRRDPILNRVIVEAEICNLYRNKSRGFNYFSLKDDKSMVSCVDFKNLMPASIKDGDLVRVIGSANIYLSRGSFQLEISSIEKSGRGRELEKLEELKKKLAAEGLFSEKRKKQLPIMPKRVGLITSPGGAVLHDFANELNKRYPLVEIILSSSSVQGVNADKEIIEALARLEEIDREKNIDLIVIARGGGSGEDLDAFNSEALVRAVAACNIPIVSAIGHQIDYSLLDLVADLRSSTPTEAAIQICKDFSSLRMDIDFKLNHIRHSFINLVNKKKLVLATLLRSLDNKRPDRKILYKKAGLDRLLVDLDLRWQEFIKRKEKRLKEILDKMSRLREEKLLKTSWLVEDLKGQSLYGGELVIGENYRLISNNYNYLIKIENKEKKIDR